MCATCCLLHDLPPPPPCPPRNQLADRRALHFLLELSRSAPPTAYGWDDALTALAVMAANHELSRGDTSRALRASLLRGTAAEMAGAAFVCVRLSHSAKGREILFSDDLVDPLVKVLTLGEWQARAWSLQGYHMTRHPSSGAAERGWGWGWASTRFATDAWGLTCLLEPVA